MAKKQKPVQQLLSPENYIRQKARKLPLYKCSINENWKDEGLAEIVIGRRHTNGNVTFGVYLVDVFCVGVKDAFYNFNVSVDTFEEMIYSLSGELNMIEIDYVLAHNIIYAAIEYAEDLGIKPCKDFTLAEYILEEDTDEIELMDIECGKDGKPLFVVSDFYTPAQANGIIQQLEKSVGKDNFYVLMTDSDDDDEYDGEYDNYEDTLNKRIDPELFVKYENMTPAGRKEIFLSLKKMDPLKMTSEDMEQLLAVTEVIYNEDVVDEEKVADYLSDYNDELLMDIAEDEYTVESLGLPQDMTLTDDDLADFEDLDFILTEDDVDNEEEYKLYLQGQDEKFNTLKATWGDIPYLSYWKLRQMDMDDAEYKSLLEEYCARFPDYALLKLEQCKYQMADNKDYVLPDFNSFFGSRTNIVSEEMYQYQFTKILNMMGPGFVGVNAAEAQSRHLEDLDLQGHYSTVLRRMLQMGKIALLHNYFEQEAGSPG